MSRRAKKSVFTSVQICIPHRKNVVKSAFTHDDRYDDRFANTVRRPVCKPIVMCEQSKSLFSNRSSYRSQESNMFDSCDPTDDRRDV